MRIGFDIDGVLADFITHYNELVIRVSGQNLLQPIDWTDPPCWNWPEHRGYDKTTMTEVWGCIKSSPSFWYSLLPTENIRTLALLLPELEHRHDVYYITHRMGNQAKRQTEAWLMRHLPYRTLDLTPTVLLSGDKGMAARTLQLDVYVDDNYANAVAVAVDSLPHGTPEAGGVWQQATNTRTYLLNRAYNQHENTPSCVRRVASVSHMFDAELPNL